MTQLNVNHLRQIERTLGRTLTDSELIPVSSVSELFEEQVLVVKTLARLQLVSALDYMRAVVPDALTPTLMKFINPYA